MKPLGEYSPKRAVTVAAMLIWWHTTAPLLLNSSSVSIACEDSLVAGAAAAAALNEQHLSNEQHLPFAVRVFVIACGKLFIHFAVWLLWRQTTVATSTHTWAQYNHRTPFCWANIICCWILLVVRIRQSAIHRHVCCCCAGILACTRLMLCETCGCSNGGLTMWTRI